MSRVGRRWTTKPRVAIAVALVVSTLGFGLYALAAALAAPTITSGPANPTKLTSASFAYSHKSSVTFQCALDSSPFSACGSGKSGAKAYPGPLSAGSHTFEVRAVSGSQTSAAASSTWTIDTTPPSVVSINRLDPNPTNAGTLRWKVTFSENVTGVSLNDFVAVKSAPSQATVTSVSGSGANYTVIVSPTFATGVSGTIGLNLVDDDSIRDAATNPLGGSGTGNGNFVGQVYTVDKVPPPKPVITQNPMDPSLTPDATFAWTDAEAGVIFQCSIDSGPLHSCTSPYSFTVATTNDGQHLFKVRAIDQAGNTSGDTVFGWKVSKIGFTIAGNIGGLLLGAWKEIPVSITNPNDFAIIVYTLTVAVGSSPASCPASSNIELQQSPISSSHTVTVGAHSTVNLMGTDRPRIRLLDRPVNQDGCKNANFGLQYGGMATK